MTKITLCLSLLLTALPTPATAREPVADLSAV